MLTEYVELGSTPAGESCAQVGADGYYDLMKVESKRYIEMLQKRFPQHEEVGISFRNKSFPHDFGSYHEVCAVYFESNELASNVAWQMQDDCPEYWADDKIITYDLAKIQEEIKVESDVI